ncbi:hypothetical protein ACFJGW_00750 [Burkholderiaceae bacterium UC74_6]
MLFYVHRLREKGFLIPRHNVVRVQGELGIFGMKEERDGETMRTLKVARLRKWPLANEDVLPPLFDAVLIYAGDSWTVTGWERGKASNLMAQPALQQSWLMRPLSLRDQLELQRERVACMTPSEPPARPS